MEESDVKLLDKIKSIMKRNPISFINNRDFIMINERNGYWIKLDVGLKDRFNILLTKSIWNEEDVKFMKNLICYESKPGIDYIFLIRNKHDEYIKYFGSYIESPSYISKEIFDDMIKEDSFIRGYMRTLLEEPIPVIKRRESIFKRKEIVSL